MILPLPPAPSPRRHRTGTLAAAVLAASLATLAAAVPIQPQRDAEVIERLPPATRVTASADPVAAAREARTLLDASRRDGDPRPAGRALARLAPWAARPDAPAVVVLAQADAEQYLHQFQPAVDRLQALVQRDPAQPQAWLMLATLHRVQGRYDRSDEACSRLQALAVQPHAEACSAENQALRGRHAEARTRLQRLLAASADPGTRAWLLTTLAELEQRAGRAGAADAAWRQALQAAPDAYARTGYADFLLDQRRDQAAWDLLRSADDDPTDRRADALLLRQAVAARRLGRPEAAALHREILARQAQADLRPAVAGHHRERALVALELDARPGEALAQARQNLRQQREPVDLWLLARSARAAGDREALAEARALAHQQGLADARLDAI